MRPLWRRKIFSSALGGSRLSLMPRATAAGDGTARGGSGSGPVCRRGAEVEEEEEASRCGVMCVRGWVFGGDRHIASRGGGGAAARKASRSVSFGGASASGGGAAAGDAHTQGARTSTRSDTNARAPII
jgi:hypothetical protein